MVRAELAALGNSTGGRRYRKNLAKVKFNGVSKCQNSQNLNQEWFKRFFGQSDIAKEWLGARYQDYSRDWETWAD
jgi:hypothetical protein